MWHILGEIKEDKKTDSQIMETLHIPQRTYYRYKSKIMDQDKRQWAEVVKDLFVPLGNPLRDYMILYDTF